MSCYLDDNPKTEVREYLKSCTEFEIDKQLGSNLLLSESPGGHVKKFR